MTLMTLMTLMILMANNFNNSKVAQFKVVLGKIAALKDEVFRVY